MANYFKSLWAALSLSFLTACNIQDGNSKYGCTAQGGRLKYLIQKNNLEELQTMLREEEVEVNAQCDKHTRTPLMEAAHLGHLEVVQALLDHPDINVNLQDQYGDTALIYAFRSPRSTQNKARKEQIAQLLLDKGADPNHQDDNGTTATMYAVMHHFPELLDWMITQNKIQVNHATPEKKVLIEKGTTVLMFAAVWGREAAIKVLLYHNANPALQDDNEKTALMSLIDNKDITPSHLKIAQLLIDKMSLEPAVQHLNYTRNIRPTDWPGTKLMRSKKEKAPLDQIIDMLKNKTGVPS